jgi:uncharacterized membrane protein YoaK (UPF0700 family)
LALASALAASAGFVDAHIYLNVTPVFVANMSGNLIHLGVFAGTGEYGDVLGSVVALVAFLLGVVVATGHHDRQLRRVGSLRPGTLLAGEAVLVASLTVLIGLFDLDFTSHVRLADAPVICVAAFAMGIQTSALRRVGAVAVATTYGTGAIVRIGEKIGLAVQRADRSTEHRRRDTVIVLLSVLASYVGGAAVAATIGSSSLLLLLPGAVLVVAAIVIGRDVDADDRGPAGR